MFHGSLIENNEIKLHREQNRTFNFNLEATLKWKLSKFIEDNAFVNGEQTQVHFHYMETSI